jgi:hypothetical protein
MNRYWGGLLATSLIGLLGLYLLYKAIRREDLVLYGVFELSPKLLAVAGLLAETIYLLYLYLGIYTGVISI